MSSCMSNYCVFVFSLSQVNQWRFFLLFLECCSWSYLFLSFLSTSLTLCLRWGWYRYFESRGCLHVQGGSRCEDARWAENIDNQQNNTSSMPIIDIFVHFPLIWRYGIYLLLSLLSLMMASISYRWKLQVHEHHGGEGHSGSQGREGVLLVPGQREEGVQGETAQSWGACGLSAMCFIMYY